MFVQDYGSFSSVELLYGIIVMSLANVESIMYVFPYKWNLRELQSLPRESHRKLLVRLNKYHVALQIFEYYCKEVEDLFCVQLSFSDCLLTVW